MTLLTPEFLFTKRYAAKRDRIALAHGGAIQAGVWDAGDLKPTWSSGMNISLAAGFALVSANNAGNLGLYHVQNDAALTVTVPPAHASLPRLDQVYILVDDSTDGGASDDTPQPLVAQGTATSGATLDNRSGAAALPSNALRIADVLTPAAASVLSAAAVRDRRGWARGAEWSYTKTSGDFFIVPAATTDIDSTNMKPRIECSGAPLEIALYMELVNTSGLADQVWPTVEVDGVAVAGARSWLTVNANPGSFDTLNLRVPYTPTSGSHVFAFRVTQGAGNRVQFKATTATPLFAQITAKPKQNASNN